MTGKILIVDALATNRIVLKVKLSAAFYQVLQASNGQEAVEMTVKNRPDLLLIGGDLPDMALTALLAGLKRATGTPPPAVVLVPHGQTEQRIAALSAGAADVIAKPLEEAVVLARLRSIMRQRHSEADLGVRAETADALGFAEDTSIFAGPQRVAVLADSLVRARETCDRLRPDMRQDLFALDHDLPGALRQLNGAPDAVVIRLGANGSDTGMSALAELQASPQTRRARILALLDPDAAHLAAPVLDMGANDAVVGPVDTRELVLRLSHQLAQKRRGDALRGQLENGLQAAVVDPLTGLYNRRYAMGFAKRMLAEAAEAGRTFAFMVADLDHFKSVNDTFGHAAGDAVLAQISKRMRKALSPGQMIARIGGEEFLIALPDTSVPEARAMADRLCRLVRERPVTLPQGGGSVQVTISIGVTVGTPRSAAGSNVDRLLNEADRALYDAKSGGRNTVTFCMQSAA